MARSAPSAPLSGIRVVAPGAEKPVELRSMDSRSETVGRFARTTVDMVFYNPNGRVLVGELQFPLQKEQTVTAFALEMEDGELRDAVAVDKSKGRETFEAIVRRGVDPALLEVTQGNNFKMRVYPLRPKATRRVRVTLTEPLPRGDRGAAKESLLVGSHAGRDYFYAEVPARETLLASASRKKPATVSILWDASLSGQERDHRAEVAALDAYFKKIGDVKVRLQRVRDVADPVLVFDVRGGDWSALRRELASTVYDGASNLGAFRIDDGSDLHLLFSDGLDNYGVEKPATPWRAPLFAMLTSESADRDKLRGMAERTGGALIDLSEKPAGAIEPLLHKYPRLVGIEGAGVANVTWQTPEPDNETIAVAGVLLSPDISLRLVFAMPDGLSRELEFVVDSQKARRSDFAPFMWATLSLRGLEAEREKNGEAILRLGKTFSRATSRTSLIVLETVQDYAWYGIEPPESLRAAYETLQIQPWNQRAEEKAKLERVVEEWQVMKEWWNKAVALPPVSKDRSPGKPTNPFDEVYDEWIYDAVAQLGARGIVSGYPDGSFGSYALAGTPKASVSRREESTGAPGSSWRVSRSAKSESYVSDPSYVLQIRFAKGEEIYRLYLKARAEYIDSSFFYLDTVFFLLKDGQRALALRVLSNLAEIDLENRENLRVLGYKLMELNEPELATAIFGGIMKIAEEEPVSWRDLGLAYALTGRNSAAVDTLYGAVMKVFPRPFSGYDTILLQEINDIVTRSSRKIDIAGIDPRLIKNMPIKLRIVLSWNTDTTDFYLRVKGPDGDYYPNRFFRARDGWDGFYSGYNDAYGPVALSMKKPKPGKYRVEAIWRSDRRQTQSNPPVLYATVFRNFGTKSGTKESVVIPVAARVGEAILIGEYEVK